jgi:outer membrane protein TolC
LKSILSIALCFIASASFAQKLSFEEALLLAKQNRQNVRSAQFSIDKAIQNAKSLGAYAPTRLGIGATTQSGLGANDQDLVLSQPFDIFGRTSAGRKLGEAEVNVAKANLQAVLLEVQTDVLQAYFNAATAVQLSQNAEELLTVAKALQKASIRRFEEGKAPEVQVTRSTIELDRAVQLAALRKSQLESALRRFYGAIGVEDENQEIDATATLSPLKTLSVDERPDLKTLLAEVKVAEAEAGIAKTGRKPELELQALRSPWGQSPSTLAARIQFTWAINDNGKSKAVANAATEKAKAAQSQYADARKRALAELSAINAEIEAANSQLSSYGQIRDAAKSLVAKSQLGYSEGVGTLVDVLEATRALREIEEELAEARSRLNLAEVARYRVTGTLVEVKK